MCKGKRRNLEELLETAWKIQQSKIRMQTAADMPTMEIPQTKPKRSHMEFPKTYRATLGWAMCVGALIALLAGLDSLNRKAVVALGLFGALGATWSAWEHGWLNGLGKWKLRPLIVLVVIWGVMGALSVVTWPPSKLGVSVPPNPPPVSQTTDEKPPTLEDLFNTEFPYTLRSTMDDIEFKEKGMTIPIKRRVYMDFQGKSKFVGFYIPYGVPDKDYDYHACLSLTQWVLKTMEDFNKHRYVAGGYPGQMTSAKELTFSKRVFLYEGDDLSIEQQADVIKKYRAAGFDAQIKGTEYLHEQVLAWHREHDHATSNR